MTYDEFKTDEYNEGMLVDTIIEYETKLEKIMDKIILLEYYKAYFSDENSNSLFQRICNLCDTSEDNKNIPLFKVEYKIEINKENHNLLESILNKYFYKIKDNILISTLTGYHIVLKPDCELLKLYNQKDLFNVDDKNHEITGYYYTGDIIYDKNILLKKAKQTIRNFTMNEEEKKLKEELDQSIDIYTEYINSQHNNKK